jgi:hypothetical protein
VVVLDGSDKAPSGRRNQLLAYESRLARVLGPCYGTVDFQYECSFALSPVLLVEAILVVGNNTDEITSF